MGGKNFPLGHSGIPGQLCLQVRGRRRPTNPRQDAGGSKEFSVPFLYMLAIKIKLLSFNRRYKGRDL